jgi:hypothetical protein
MVEITWMRFRRKLHNTAGNELEIEGLLQKLPQFSLEPAGK